MNVFALWPFPEINHTIILHVTCVWHIVLHNITLRGVCFQPISISYIIILQSSPVLTLALLLQPLCRLQCCTCYIHVQPNCIIIIVLYCKVRQKSQCQLKYANMYAVCILYTQCIVVPLAFMQHLANNAYSVHVLCSVVFLLIMWNYIVVLLC